MALHCDRPSNHGSVRASSVGSTAPPIPLSPAETESAPPITETSAPAPISIDTANTKRNDPTSPRSPSTVLAKKPKSATDNRASPAPKKTVTIEVLNAGNVRSPGSATSASAMPLPSVAPASEEQKAEPLAVEMVEEPKEDDTKKAEVVTEDQIDTPMEVDAQLGGSGDEPVPKAEEDQVVEAEEAKIEEPKPAVGEGEEDVVMEEK